MTTLQKITVTTALAAALGAYLYEARQTTGLREENAAVRREMAALTGKMDELQKQRDAALKRQSSLAAELADTKKTQNNNEVLRLRGEVGVLRRDNETIGKKSPLNKITADPATRKLIRDQQKMGMKVLFGDLTKNLKLEKETQNEFDDLMADHVMDNIDLITQTLQDKNTRGEIDRLFAGQDSALENKVLALLGQDGLNQFRDYSKDLLSNITANQFEGSFSGDKEAKAAKKQQFLTLLREETQTALNYSGLPADYQTVPMLNFRNIASAEQADVSLKLMSDIYGRVADRAASFLDAEEAKKFLEYRSKALENSRTILLMNRNMMAPIAQ